MVAHHLKGSVNEIVFCLTSILSDVVPDCLIELTILPVIGHDEESTNQPQSYEDDPYQ